jgi:hypothetical protein
VTATIQTLLLLIAVLVVVARRMADQMTARWSRSSSRSKLQFIVRKAVWTDAI